MNFSEELFRRIKVARRRNSMLACAAIFMIAAGVWLYQYSGIHIPFYINAIVALLVIVVGHLTYDWANSLALVFCPKCNSVVENGKLIGDSMPACCPKCNLIILGVK